MACQNKHYRNETKPFEKSLSGNYGWSKEYLVKPWVAGVKNNQLSQEWLESSMFPWGASMLLVKKKDEGPKLRIDC